jgi:1-acyl-sn-glycerol-3-phosphate acyltransferase
VNFFKKFYTIYVAFVTASGFLLLMPLYALFVEIKYLRRYGNAINNIWAHWVFKLSFLDVEYIYETPLEKGKSYVFCPNHTSYLDIPCMQLIYNWKIKYVGKKALCELPLFGYMFRNFHIGVDRESRVEKYKTFVKCSQAIDEGFSIILFPEGTIPTKNPDLIPFKEGAFRLAFEKKIPIVPVTMPFNWIALPDTSPAVATRHKLKIIVHQPIETTDLTADHTDWLKEKTFQIIDTEIKKWNNIQKD